MSDLTPPSRTLLARFASFAARIRQTSHVWLMVFAGVATARVLVVVALAWTAVDGGAGHAVVAPAILTVFAGAIAVPTLAAAARGRCPRWLSVVAGGLLAMLLIAESAAALLILAVTVGPTWLTGTWLAALLFVQAPVAAVVWWPAVTSTRVAQSGT